MKRILSFLIIAFAFTFTKAANALPNDIVVQISLEGVVSIKNTSSYTWNQWSIEYGPVGFTPGTGTLISGITSNTKIVPLNQFQNYHLRIRNELVFGNNYGWSNMFLIDNCASTTIPVNYYTDFSAFPVQNCWRGYKLPNASGNISYDSFSGIGNTPGSVFLSSNSFDSQGVILISPRLENPSTTKKISFMLKSYLADGLSVGTLSNPADVTTFSLLQTITPATTQPNTWVQVTVNFDNYNGTDEYIAIKLKKPTSQSPDTKAYIDNFRYQERCYDMLSFNVSNTLEHSAQLNFTAPAEQTEWEAYYNINGNTFGTTVSITSTPFILEGLSANTNYQVKMRAKCAENNYSAWSQTIDFHTPCATMEAGFSYSFENNPLDVCWSKIVNSVSDLRISNGLMYNTTQVISPRSGNLMLELDPIAYNKDYYLITRRVEEIDPAARIKFFMIVNSDFYFNTKNVIIGTMSDPSNGATFVPLKTITPLEMSERIDNKIYDYWKMHTVELSNYNQSNNHKYIAFKVTGNGSANKFFIDDFAYEITPECKEPLNLSTQVKYDSVKLLWEGSSQSYQIEYGPAGFIQGTGTIAGSNSQSLDLTTLQNAQKYDFYVRGVCGSNFSAWSEKRSFATRCEGVVAGYSYSFEQEALYTVNSCWTTLTAANANNNTYQVIQTPDVFIKTIAGTSQRPAHTGTVMVQHRTYNTPAEKNILIMPRLNDLNNLKVLKFWMYAWNISSGQSRQIIVGTLSDPDDYTTFTPIKTITVTSQNYDQWKEYVVDFSFYTGSNKFVGIRQATSNGDQILYFDDFSYESITCATPTNILAAQAGPSSAALWFTSNSAETQQSYEILLDGQSVITTQNPYTAINLAEGGHSYKVRNICDNGLTGDWSVVRTFKISCVKTAPFTENFDSYASDDFYEVNENWCWTTYNSTPGFDDHTYIVASCIDQLNSCPNMLALNSSTNMSNVVDEVGMIASPYFSDFNNTKKIRFFAKHQWEESYVEDAGFIIGTMSNPYDQSTFVPYQTILLDPEDFYGREFEIDFSDYTGSAKHIAIKNSGLNHSYLHIDDFKYSSINASCPEPLNVRMIAATSNSAIAGWIETGSGQTFAIEYGPQGFAPGTGTIVSGTGTELTMVNLSPSTNYEFYIKAACGSAQSVVQGPFKFFTTCVEPSLPYSESFAGMDQYGDNLLPDCFRMKSGGLKSSNVGIYNGSNNFYPSQLMQGNTDSNFIYANDDPEFITPVFNMSAGTTYTFTMMGRKVYQWNGYGLFVRTGRSNSIYNIVTGLTNTSSEFNGNQYKPATFMFTPLVSGNYSFHVKVSGNPALLLDDFTVTEGYTSMVDGANANFDFGSSNSALLLEATDNTFVSMGNGNAFMSGGNGNTMWVNSGNDTGRMNVGVQSQSNTNVWEANENFVTKINMKVNASAMTSLYMSFDLKQTFRDVSSESMFRVIVNGAAVGTVIMPITAAEDDFITHYFNLSQFAGTDVKISLQHIGRSALGYEEIEDSTGDNAYVDNIIFSQFPLSAGNFQFSGFKLYPNPTQNILNLKNDLEISAVEILNINGQKLYQDSPRSTNVKINLSGFSEGIYLIKVKFGGQSQTFKFVKN